MKLNRDFVVHNTEKESILVPAGGAAFAGVMKGNRTLGAVLELLKEETGEEKIVEAMCAKYDAPKEKIACDVKMILESLRGIGALDE